MRRRQLSLRSAQMKIFLVLSADGFTSGSCGPPISRDCTPMVSGRGSSVPAGAPGGTKNCVPSASSLLVAGVGAGAAAGADAGSTGPAGPAPRPAGPAPLPRPNPRPRGGGGVRVDGFLPPYATGNPSNCFGNPT